MEQTKMVVNTVQYSKPTSSNYCLVIFRVVGWLARNAPNSNNVLLVPLSFFFSSCGDVPIFTEWYSVKEVVVVMEVNFWLDTTQHSLNKNGSLLCRFFSIKDNQSRTNAIQQMQWELSSVPIVVGPQ